MDHDELSSTAPFREQLVGEKRGQQRAIINSALQRATGGREAGAATSHHQQCPSESNWWERSGGSNEPSSTGPFREQLVGEKRGQQRAIINSALQRATGGREAGAATSHHQQCPSESNWWERSGGSNEPLRCKTNFIIMDVLQSLYFILFIYSK